MRCCGKPNRGKGTKSAGVIAIRRCFVIRPNEAASALLKSVLASEGTHQDGAQKVEYVSRNIFHHQGGKDFPKVKEGVLEAPDERFGGLPVHRLAVGFARVAQDDAEEVGAAPLAVRSLHRGTAAEVDLRFLPRLALHASKGQRTRRSQPPHKPLHRLIAALKAVLTPQVLLPILSGLGRQSLVQLADDRSPQGSQRLCRPADPGIEMAGYQPIIAGWV